ncbi:fimbria/pilus outer membrane usher protein [Pseudomonas sp. 58 R 3]|uniref:fimbria/pilus outer membrane usher protein n=1 Tax=Pseudomonas sp. 58 R 3 TaxID=1844108 RepID=UPI000811FEEC|nr:fimbria/pilus outer membrane usher protein [Pseudomonas sp. 58 R 3]CRM79463.1 Outer membrane usher protein FimD precursor [Pseudomonas sp. 58 R 3]
MRVNQSLPSPVGRRSGLFLGLAALWGAPGFAWAGELGEGFDLAVLASYGIDPKVSDYFRSAARFREGMQVVGLRVNGNSLGLVEARFDYQGQLCFTQGLLEKAGLKVPAAIVQSGISADQACHDFMGEFPATIVRLQPGREEVALVVPTQSLREAEWEAGSFSEGGAAALFNYDVLGFQTQSRSGPSRFVSAYTEAGFNLGNWVVRSRQFFISDNGKSRSEHVQAYAQRDIAALRSTFQVGQISTQSPVFGGVQLSGFQLFPDGVSRTGASNGVVVEGVAHSQARVEVRQSGALIHTTLVPEGPFSLTGLPLLNGTSDLEVSVIGTRGGTRSFVVPAASFSAAIGVTPGFDFALGKVREQLSDGREAPTVAMGSGTWGLGRQSSLGFGLLSTDEYHSAGGTFSSVFFQRVTVSARHNLSRDGEVGVDGGRSSLSLSSPLVAGIEMSLSATTQSQGYRDVLEAGRRLKKDELQTRFQNQYTAGLSWADPTLGAFAVNYARSTQFDGQLAENVFASWSKGFRQVDVALIADSQVGASRRRKTASRERGMRDEVSPEGVSLRLQVTVPFGDDRRLTSYASRRNGRADMGTALSERVNEYVNYEVGVERDLQDRQQAVRANVDVIPRYTRVGLGMNRTPTSTSYNGQLQGAVVAHERGLTFSPYKVQDTFGVLSVGDVSAAKVSTPQGPVWTDYRGHAVIPGLPAYTTSRLEVQTQSLPKRVDLKNGTKILAAGRGSFNTVDFQVVNVRRVLLEVRDDQGAPLPQGSAVFGPDNTYLTNVVGEGLIFLNNMDDGQILSVSPPGSTRACLLHLNLESQPQEDKLYETASAVCRAQ